ncbi:hypothetical protein C0991_006646, partial [Blastosporella zonata]
MDRIRDNFLPKDWADAVSNQLLSLRMSTNTTFLSHYNTALGQNLMLKGTDMFLDDRAFINQLKSSIPTELYALARDEGLTREYDLKKFKAGLVEVDKKRVNDRKRIRNEAEDVARKRFGSSNGNNRYTTTIPATTNYRPRLPSSSSSRPPSTSISIGGPVRLKQLTKRERSYLMETRGCLKCRQPNMSHRAADCPNGFPDATFTLHIPASFRAATTIPSNAQRNVSTAGFDKNKGKPVAAFTPSNWGDEESNKDE